MIEAEFRIHTEMMITHTHTGIRHIYNQQDRTRERPSDDPIAQRPPNYQIQATGHGQQEQGAHPRPSGTFPHMLQHLPVLRNTLRTDRIETLSITRTILRLNNEYGLSLTSASLHAGRLPFFPLVESLLHDRCRHFHRHMAPSIMTNSSGPMIQVTF